MTYDLNFQNPKMTLGDIWKIKIDDIPKFDVLTAGFPCQPPKSLSGLIDCRKI